MSRWLSLIFVFFAVNVLAQPCNIEMSDLTDALQSDGKAKVLTVSNLTDIYSNEPIRRHVQALSDGTIVVVEQKHCLIYNLTITILLPEGQPIDKAPGRLANTLNSTVVWKEWFKDLDALKILKSEFTSNRFSTNVSKMGSFTYSLDDKIVSKNNNSETLLRMVNLDSGTLPFNVIISLYISVGGL